MTTHVPTFDVLVRNDDCTCPKMDDQREADLEAVCHQLDIAASADDDGREWGAPAVALADLIAEARREGAEQGWNEGHNAGWYDALTRRPESDNPYRQEKPA